MQVHSKYFIDRGVKRWLSNLLVLWALTLNQKTDAMMLDYVNPSYQITVTPSGDYQIDVRIKLDQDSTKSEETRKRTLIQEAEKDPLFAMAFVQKLAADGDSQAIDIRSIYQSYRKFFENSDSDPLEQACHKIISDENSDPLSLQMAKYIASVLTKQPRGSSIALYDPAARTLCNQLIPGIEQTLELKLPQKMGESEEVTLAEIVAPHRAFPDLIKYRGYYYACFREATSHVSYLDFGKVRLLKGSFDEKTQSWKWGNEVLLSKEGYDLRDPRFFINGQGILQLIIGGSKIDPSGETALMLPHVAILKNDEWSLLEATCDPSASGPIGQWIWRVTWNDYDNRGYALSYGQGSTLCLMRTDDGIKFDKVALLSCPPLTDLSEATVRFKPDGSAVALIRSRNKAVIATATPVDGYTQWSMNPLPFRLGGPNFLITKQQQMWAATRYFFLREDNSLDEATIMASMDEQSLSLSTRLKSHGDSSYPGMLLEGDVATIIYYSTPSENKSRIYIARFKLPD